MVGRASSRAVLGAPKQSAGGSSVASPHRDSTLKIPAGSGAAKSTSPALSARLTVSSFALNSNGGCVRNFTEPAALREMNDAGPTLTKRPADWRRVSISSNSAGTPRPANCNCRTRRWTATVNRRKRVLTGPPGHPLPAGRGGRGAGSLPALFRAIVAPCQ